MAVVKERQGQQRKRNSRRKILFDEVQKQVQILRQSDQLVFLQLLEEEVVEQMLEKLGCRYRHRIYTPGVTLGAFLEQAISDDGSCQQAVHRINNHRCRSGLPPASVDTNSYCEARRRLPEELFLQLLKRSAERVQRSEPETWLWNDRRVVLVDGCTARAADTEANQAAFPQPSSQQTFSLFRRQFLRCQRRRPLVSCFSGALPRCGGCGRGPSAPIECGLAIGLDLEIDAGSGAL